MMPRNKGNVDEVERIHINVSSSSDSDSELDISLRTRCNKLKEFLSQKPPERVRLKDLAKDRRKSFHFRKSLVHAAVCEFVENQEQQQTPVDENKNCNVKNLSANTRRRRFLTSSTPQVSNNIARFSSGDVSSINETDSENSKKDAAKEEGRSVQISDKNQTKHTPEITSINNSTDSCIKRLEASANINRTRRRRDKENSTNVTRQTDEVPEREKSKDNKAGDLQESNKNISGRSLRSRGKNIVEAVVEKLQVSTNVMCSKSGKVVNNNETLKRSVFTTPKGLRGSVLNNNHRRSRSLNVEKVCEVIPESDEDFDRPISISGMQKISRNVTDTKDPESSDSSTGSNTALCHVNFLYESLERGPMESPKPWRCDFSNSNARESLSLGFTNISANPIEERRTYTRGRKKCVYGRSKNSESTKESKLLNIISRLSLKKESSFIESSDEDNCPPKTKNDVQNNNSRSRTVGNISQQKDQTPGQRDSPQGSSTYNKSATTPQLFVLLNKSTNKKKVVSSRTPHRDKSSNKNDDVSNHRNSSRTPLRSTQKDEGSRMSLRSPHKGNHSTRIASRSRSPHKENCSRSPPPNTPKKSLEPPHKENSSPRTASRSPLSKKPKKTPQQKKDSSSKRLKTVGKNLCNIPVKAETSTSNHELPNSDTCVSDVIENIPPVIEYLELQLSPRSDKTTQKNITMDKNTTTEKHNKDIVKDQSKESNSSRGKRLQEVDDSIKMPPPKTKPKPRSRKVQVNVYTEEDSVTSSTNSGEINEPPQVRRSGRISRPPRHAYEFEEVWLIKNAKQRNNKSTKKENKMTKCTGVTHDTHGFVRIKPNSEKLTDLHQKHDLIILALSGNGEVIVNNEVSKIFSDKRSTFEVPTGMRYLIKNTSHEDDLELFYVTRLTRY